MILFAPLEVHFVAFRWEYWITTPGVGCRSSPVPFLGSYRFRTSCIFCTTAWTSSPTTICRPYHLLKVAIFKKCFVAAFVVCLIAFLVTLFDVFSLVRMITKFTVLFIFIFLSLAAHSPGVIPAFGLTSWADLWCLSEHNYEKMRCILCSESIAPILPHFVKPSISNVIRPSNVSHMPFSTFRFFFCSLRCPLIAHFNFFYAFPVAFCCPCIFVATFDMSFMIPSVTDLGCI